MSVVRMIDGEGFDVDKKKWYRSFNVLLVYVMESTTPVGSTKTTTPVTTVATPLQTTTAVCQDDPGLHCSSSFKMCLYHREQCRKTCHRCW